MASSMICMSDYEKFAFENLPKAVLDYYKSGADDEITLHNNCLAYKRYLIRPRFLRDVSVRDLSVIVLGQKLDFPIGIAPTAMQRMAHDAGEIASAKAAASLNTLMILSTLSTTKLEDVAAASSPGIKWFQLYIYRNREITENLVQRAEKSGYKALVLTIDAPYFGQRLADVRNKFKLPSHLRLANFDPTLMESIGINSSNKESGLSEYSQKIFDPSLNWNDITWLKTFTKLPLILKGILTVEDALLAVKYGADGIIVSNHGGRQLDGVPASIDVLPEICAAVQNRCELYIDGGIRNGTDVLKAIALGAKMVFVGRPVLWGLSYQGEEGVRQVLEMLRKELDLAMALSGCSHFKDVTGAMVVRESYYKSHL